MVVARDTEFVRPLDTSKNGNPKLEFRISFGSPMGGRIKLQPAYPRPRFPFSSRAARRDFGRTIAVFLVSLATCRVPYHAMTPLMQRQCVSWEVLVKWPTDREVGVRPRVRPRLTKSLNWTVGDSSIFMEF